MSFEVGFGFGSPGRAACEHFVEDDPDGPHVAFRGVDIVVECLEWHVDRRAHVVICVFLELLAPHGKTEICYLDVFGAEEDICRLQVAVHDPRTVDSPISL